MRELDLYKKIDRRKFLQILSAIGLAVASLSAYLLTFGKNILIELIKPEPLIPPENDKYNFTVIAGSSSVIRSGEKLKERNDEFRLETEDPFNDDVKKIHKMTRLLTKNSSDHKYLLYGRQEGTIEDMSNWFEKNIDQIKNVDRVILATGFTDVFYSNKNEPLLTNIAINYVNMVRYLIKNCPKARIVIAYPFPTYAGSNNDQDRKFFINEVNKLLDEDLEINKKRIDRKNTEVLVMKTDESGKSVIDPDTFKESEPDKKRHLNDEKQKDFIRLITSPAN